MKLLNQILAEAGNSSPDAPPVRQDQEFQVNVDQTEDIGMPSINHEFQLREALMVRPYYLGNEERFYEQLKKFPTLDKMLGEDSKPKEEAPPAEPKTEVEEEKVTEE